ncbi:TPA: hypothetical protein TUK08_000250 [Streptococcus equi subsp. zooepidemicus]|nr:hypothetical protein [Streptococcus equi subsp. zooepidemicus]HEL0295751.1 hypothetical protein [Streptococcus equi subsp. zooepidemicus]
MNGKDFLVFIVLFRMVLKPIIWFLKYMYKSGGAIFLLAIIYLDTLEKNSTQYALFQFIIPLLLSWFIWWHIRFVIRLVKKDETWGSIGRLINRRKVS